MMQHSPGFLALVKEASKDVSEVSVAEAKQMLAANDKVRLIDVREDSEWNQQHAAEALHLGKGIFERDIEVKIPDKSTEIILYCGGGYRSILTAEVAQRMGYRHVHSLAGGYKAMLQADWPMESIADPA